MAADNILGKILIEGANQAASIAGGNPSLGSGLAGGGTGTRSAERETRSFQKTVKDAQIKSVAFAKSQPQWWTRMFKTLGIQMGLAGILKQSQVFTSTVGAFFQIFGAMVDVMLAPLVKPVLIPVMRWLARQIPTMGKLSRAVFGFLGNTFLGIVRWTKTLFSTSFWTEAFKNVIGAITALPEQIWRGIKDFLREFWNKTFGGRSWMGFEFPEWGEETKGPSSVTPNNTSTPRPTPTSTNGDNNSTNGNNNSTDGPFPTGYPGSNEANKTAEDVKRFVTEEGSALEVAASGYMTATVARYLATPAKLLTKAVSPGILGKPLDIAFDAMKKPHQAMNYIIKNGVKIAANAANYASAGRLGNIIPEGGLNPFRKPTTTTPTTNPTVPRRTPNWTAAADDAGDSASTATRTSGLLTKVKIQIMSFTSWAKRQLKDLKNIITGGRVKAVLDEVATRANKIILQIDNIPPTSISSTAREALKRTVGLIKTAVLRAFPFIGAAVGVAETVYGVKKILGSDLNWFVPKEDTMAAYQSMERMTGISNLYNEYKDLETPDRHWANPMRLWDAKLKSSAQMSVLTTAQTTALADYMNQTKAGNLFGQMALGGLSTAAGLVGPAGLPVSAASSTAQMIALFGALDERNQESQLAKDLFAAYSAGAQSVQKEVTIKIDGNPAILDVPW